MLVPPVKPTNPSTTVILRWVRNTMRWPRRAIMVGLKNVNWMPFDRNRATKSGGSRAPERIGDDPHLHARRRALRQKIDQRRDAASSLKM